MDYHIIIRENDSLGRLMSSCAFLIETKYSTIRKHLEFYYMFETLIPIEDDGQM